MKRNSLFDMIGHTPLIKLEGLAGGAAANVFVNPEYVNPSGSLKDRIALRMIEDDEEKRSGIMLDL